MSSSKGKMKHRTRSKFEGLPGPIKNDAQIIDETDGVSFLGYDLSRDGVEERYELHLSGTYRNTPSGTYTVRRTAEGSYLGKVTGNGEEHSDNWAKSIEEDLEEGGTEIHFI